MLFLGLVVKFSQAIFLFLPLDWICSQVHTVISLLFLWSLVTENSSIIEVH